MENNPVFLEKGIIDGEWKDDDDEKDMSWIASGWAGLLVKFGWCMCVCGLVWDGTSL